MNTKITSVLKKKDGKIHSLEVGRSVVDVVKMMTEFGIGSVLITQGEAYVGIITERDLARRCVHADVDITRTPVESVMTSPVAFITSSTTVAEALKVMTETDRRHLPVFDDAKLVGIVSLGDLLRWLTNELDAHVSYLESYIRGR